MPSRVVPENNTKLDIDLYKEFKGMLVRDVNTQTAYLRNPYIEKIKEYSEFAKERSALKFPPAKGMRMKTHGKIYKHGTVPNPNQCTDDLNSV